MRFMWIGYFCLFVTWYGGNAATDAMSAFSYQYPKFGNYEQHVMDNLSPIGRDRALDTFLRLIGNYYTRDSSSSVTTGTTQKESSFTNEQQANANAVIEENEVLLRNLEESVETAEASRNAEIAEILAAIDATLAAAEQDQLTAEMQLTAAESAEASAIELIDAITGTTDTFRTDSSFQSFLDTISARVSEARNALSQINEKLALIRQLRDAAAAATTVSAATDAATEASAAAAEIVVMRNTVMIATTAAADATAMLRTSVRTQCSAGTDDADSTTVTPPDTDTG